MSACRFFLFSESTARSSRSSVSSKNSGWMKNWAKRSRAPKSGACDFSMGSESELASDEDWLLVAVDEAESSK